MQEYVSDNAHLVTGEDAVVPASVRSIPGVRWADVYLRFFKILPVLLLGACRFGASPGCTGRVHP